MVDSFGERDNRDNWDKKQQGGGGKEKNSKRTTTRGRARGPATPRFWENGTTGTKNSWREA